MTTALSTKGLDWERLSLLLTRLDPAPPFVRGEAQLCARSKADIDELVPRFTITVVDRGYCGGAALAVFIVPVGREAEWLFSHPEGQAQLAKDAGHSRLVRPSRPCTPLPAPAPVAAPSRSLSR